MRILSMMAQAYPPQQAGGMQIVARDRALDLEGRGHAVALAAALSLRGRTGLRAAAQFARGTYPIARERRDGLALFRVRGIRRRAGAVLDAFAPDAVLLASMDARPIAREISRRGIPLVVCFHDAEIDRWGGGSEGIVARFVSNSRYTASVYERSFGIRSVVIPPPVRSDRYRVPPGQGDSIVFVNPVAEKGLAVALALAAACPDLPFLFVESWVLRRRERRALRDQIRPFPNIRLIPAQADMRPVYAAARLVLVPSRWGEGWGRVASEAQVSAIPVLAASVGGLPEAVGPGGVLVPPDAPPGEWVAALRRMLEPGAYARLSAAAGDHARREDFTFEHAMGRVVAELRAAVEMGPEGASAETETAA